MEEEADHEHEQEQQHISPTATTQQDYTWPVIRYDLAPQRTRHFFKQFRTSSSSPNNFLKGIKWSPDGSCFLTSSEDNTMHLFSLPDNGSDSDADGRCLAIDEDSYDASLIVKEGESVYDFCWYPYMSAETGEALPDTTTVASPARIDDEAMAPVGMEAGEINSPEMITDEKNDEGDIGEEIGEGSDKSNDGSDQIAVETEQNPEAASVAGERTTAAPNTEVDALKQASSSVAEAEEVRQVSPASNTSTVVNLAERARQRAMLRRGGGGAPAVLSPPSARGRGRVIRGPLARDARGARGARGGRGGRSGRGQPPSQQG